MQKSITRFGQKLIWCSRHDGKLGAWLTEDQFHKGKNNYCKECRSAYFKETYDPLKARERNFRHYYKQDGSIYDILFARQCGVCAICKQPPEPQKMGRNRTEVNYLCLDHDHATGAMRGLLCHGCNFILGWMHDNPQAIENVKEYLKKA